MIRRAAAVLLALGLAACHEDPIVEIVLVSPVPGALGVTSSGGNAAATGTGINAGTGGAGGGLSCFAQFLLSIATLTTQPLAPSAGTAPAPAGGDTIVAAATADVSVPGSVFVDATITTADDVGDGIITLESLNGDVVVSGTLTAFDGGAGISPDHLRLLAPNGTVWITGTVRTANTAALAGGDGAGNVIISAARVVITGTLDTRGEAASSPNDVGGDGGTVAITSTAGGVLLGAGTILTSGGDGNTTGGAGGDVTITSDQKMNLYGTITSSGGSVTAGTANDVVGGPGGDFVFDSPVALDLIGTITSRGGVATTTGDGATGGAGGDVSILASAGAPLRLYGALDVPGGAASADDVGVGPGLVGGAGGVVQLGNGANRLLSIETGLGTYDHSGGSGELLGGGGGTITLNCSSGELLVGGTLLAQGGSSGAGTGGDGAAFSAVLGGTGPMTSTATINTSGGSTAGAVAGGAPGNITFTVPDGDLTASGSLVASAGSSSLAAPSDGGVVTGSCGAASGRILWTAAVTALGGDSTAAVPLGGGDGGSLLLTVLRQGASITLNATVSLDGGDATGAAVAGVGGTVTLTTNLGDVSISGSLLARGGAGPDAGGTGGTGGMVLVTTHGGSADGADIALATGSTIDVSGGGGTTGGSARPTIPLPFNAVTFDADGGAAADSASDGRIDVAGTILARGVSAGGFGGDVLLDGRAADGVGTAPVTTNVSVTGNPSPANDGTISNP